MNRIAFVLIAVLFSVNSAFAVNLKFKLNITSSGPSMYACDAGIKHAPHSQRICYDRKTGQSCDVGTCPAGSTAANCNCVCTGGANSADGEHRLDLMKAGYASWVDNGEVPSSSSIQSKVVYADPYNYKRIFNDKNEWNNQLTSLEYNLGSERYGTEMYLDICYRGSQIEYFQNAQLGNGSSDSPNHNLLAQATVTDIVTSNGLSYTQLAELKVRVDASCDVQGLGTYIYAHDGHGNYDDALAHTISDILTGGDIKFSYPQTAGTYTNFNANTEYLLNTWINQNNAKTPRFCKIRYTFIENKRNATTNPLTQIRKWKIQQAQICTFTEINEPAL